MSDMTTKEFIQAIEEGKAQVLTLEKAKQLTGKRINAMYFRHVGQASFIFDFIVGGVKSSWDSLKEQEPFNGYRNKGYKTKEEYWEGEILERDKEELKATEILYKENWERTNIFCEKRSKIFAEPTFVCYDLDCEVYFIEVEE